LLSIEVQLLKVITVPRQSVGFRIKFDSVTDWAVVRIESPIKMVVTMAEVVR
jgi:hypothetical protein